jgi:ABC-type dipeptide/oligopeptide/nickel transport system permease component
MAMTAYCAPVFFVGLWGAVLLIVLALIADAIVSRLDPRVRSSHDQAW